MRINLRNKKLLNKDINKSFSNHRFPYGYLVTTSLQSWTESMEVALLTTLYCYIRAASLSLHLAHSQSVTGGVYRALELIHRGMLIRDY